MVSNVHRRREIIWFVISKAENYMPRFPISSSAPSALASLFTSVQHCLEMLVHYLVTFSNLRLTIDDFTAYPQVNVFTTTCGSLSESKPEPQYTTRHIILSLGNHFHKCLKSSRNGIGKNLSN